MKKIVTKKNFKKRRLRTSLARFLKDNPAVLWLYNTFFTIKNKKNYYSDIERREKLSFFDYVELSKPLPYLPIEKVRDSNFYGHAKALKEYCGIQELHYSIEHGLYYADNYIPMASFTKTVNRIITLSDYRKSILCSQLTKPIVTVGPYIHYAKILYASDDLQSLKERMGRTLLYFPTHQSTEDEIEYDVQEDINIVLKFANDKAFDTILVCMFYLDIINTNYAQIYEKNGLKIVTAGNRYDFNFINRLKTIISLADYTLSNNVGTHTGYCVYMHKPHYVFTDQLYKMENSALMLEVGDAFSEYSQDITSKQLQVINKYWGLDCVRTPEELREILQSCENQ